MRFCIFVESDVRGGLNTFLKNFVSNNKTDQIEIICNRKFFIDKAIKKKIKKFTYEFDQDKNKILKYLFFFKKIIKFNQVFSRVKSNKLLVVNGGHPGSINAIFSILSWYLIKKNKSVIYNFHNLASKPNYKNFLINLLTNIVILLFTCKIITVSKAALKSIENIYLLRNKTSKIIYNGTIDFGKKKQNFSKKRKNIFLILASYEKRKGIHVAIKAFNIFCNTVNNYQLHIYGDKNAGYFSEINKRWKSLKNKSKIKINSFNQNNLYLIKKCDALIMPSIQFESFGYTLIEAMSLKKIVLAANTGGMPEIIKNNFNGYIFKPDSAKSLSNKLFFFVKENQYKKNIIRKNARNTFLKYFNSKDMYKKYIREIKLIK